MNLLEALFRARFAPYVNNTRRAMHLYEYEPFERRGRTRRAESELRKALENIEEDAGWLHDNVPDYTPDGVATLRDIAREIAKTAYLARVALTEDGES